MGETEKARQTSFEMRASGNEDVLASEDWPRSFVFEVVDAKESIGVSRVVEESEKSGG